MITITDEERSTMSPEQLEKIKEHNRLEALRMGHDFLDDGRGDHPWTLDELREALVNVAPLLVAYRDYASKTCDMLETLVSQVRVCSAYKSNLRGQYDHAVKHVERTPLTPPCDSKILSQPQAEAALAYSAINMFKLRRQAKICRILDERLLPARHRSAPKNDLERALVEEAHVVAMNQIWASFEVAYCLFSVLSVNIIAKENLPQYFYLNGPKGERISQARQMHYYFEWEGKLYDSYWGNHLVKGQPYDAFLRIEAINKKIFRMLARVEEQLTNMSRTSRHTNNALFLNDTGHVWGQLQNLKRSIYRLETEREILDVVRARWGEKITQEWQVYNNQQQAAAEAPEELASGQGAAL